MSNNIDLVITYVDNRDIIWQKEFNKYINSSNPQRYRSWDNLIYWFRAVDKYMNFIRKVHIVVSNIEQIPTWLDQSKVHVVLHKDIIPEQYLPTFNSTTIEMFLYKIEGLSEKFIYSNDDMFPNNYLTENDFFENDLPIYSLIKRTHANNTFRMQCKNSYNLAAKLNNIDNTNNYFYIKHSMDPMLKSMCSEVWAKGSKEILSTLTRFREPFNLTQYLFPVYTILKNCWVEKEINFAYYTLDFLFSIVDELRTQKHKVICINDVNSRRFEADKQQLLDEFKKLYSTKCKYEKYDT